MSALFPNVRETVRHRRPARGRSLSLAVEGLDQRCLLSMGVGHPMVAHTAMVAHPNDFEGNGVVVKTPNFYEDYVGPKLAELNAVAAIGQIQPNGSFLFVGVNQGAIDPKVPATFVFGIDRSGKLPTGPFPGRPDIRFDATVVIKLVPGQAPTVTLNDLANKTVTTFQAPALAISNNVVAVNIPGFLLPSTGLSPSHYRFDYWPEDGQAGSTHIASFGPEFHDIQVGVHG
jgi:hypothetical protein